MEIQSQMDYQNLQMYISYDGHLYAEQLSALLTSLNNLYNHLYVASYGGSIPLPLEARMRIKECHTGHSIILELMEGFRQVLNTTGPTIQIMGITGIVSTMAHLIIKYAKASIELRNLWYESQMTKLKAEQFKHQIEVEESKSQLSKEPPDLSNTPDKEKQGSNEALTEMFTFLEYAPNINSVQVNGVTILDKRQQE